MVKVLVVAQTPPPYLGQPIMIGHLVNSQMPGVDLRHVRVELSAQAGDVGRFRWRKFLRLVPTVLQIVWAQLANRADILYYPPATASRMSVFRDYVILGLTRWMFSKTVFHFHAVGHAELYARLPRWQRWLFRRAYFGAEGAIRLTERTPEDAKALQAQREYIVPNGIEDLGANLVRTRAGHEVSTEKPLSLLFVALLSESKGLLVLIEACAELVARKVPVRLEVMGRFETPEFEQRTRALVTRLGLDQQVVFLGILAGEAKLAAFARADVLCHPTFNDSFGLVIVEAMACSLPVVATRWCSIPTIVVDGETGFLVEPHDPRAVADRLALLADDAGLRERMGRAGRKRFLSEYSLPRHIERMRRALLDVAGETLAQAQHTEARSHEPHAPRGERRRQQAGTRGEATEKAGMYVNSTGS
jgi:glycosyltransferase involved in cell wall biosynthesis